MSIEILPMRPQDIPALAQLERECFVRPWSENALGEELFNEQAHFLCARLDSELAGYIGVMEICGEAFIANLAVSPPFRQRGVGRALLDAAARGALERGCTQLTLEVRKSNAPAIALYSGAGFQKVGERRAYYTEPTEDAAIMTKDL